MASVHVFFIYMDFLILALAIFRISTLVAEEDGPFHSLEWIRERIGVRRDEHGNDYGLNNFATGLICKWCNSIWISIILTAVYMFFKQEAVLFCLPFAFSSMTLILSRWIDG